MKKLLLTGALSLLLLAQTAVPSPLIVSGAILPSDSIQYLSSDMRAQPKDNGLYWINAGATYRSGATLQFYATGAGYGPDEPQELQPVKHATRYKPVSWSVGKVKGSWQKYTEKTTGQNISGTYSSGEYRFKGSFTLNTTKTKAVPYTLRVKYQREVYDGNRWKPDGKTAYNSVRFYIKKVSDTTTSSKPKPAVGSYRVQGDIVYQITGASSVAAASPANNSVKSVNIPKTVTISGYKFKVKKIADKAFSNCTNLKTVAVGSSVASIGAKAFYNCKNLEKISLKTTRLMETSVRANAFKGIKNDCLFRVPPGMASFYKNIVQTAGAPKDIQVEKYD